MDITIRLATPEDAGALLGIYSYYVENTPITYELKCPTVEDFRNRIAKTLEHYPYLVAEVAGKPAGYCYASRFRERAAYDHCVEMSIYIDKDAHHEGIGTALYEELEKRLKTPLCAGYSQSLCQHYRKRRAFYTFSCKAWLYQSSPFPQMWTQI